jgi:serine/threonine protein kinase
VSAAEKLSGTLPETGWRIVKMLTRSPTATGGVFSVSYLVEKEGRRGFLKAFDFSRAFEPGTDTVKALQVLTSSFEHEREILTHCRTRKLSRVVTAIDHGQTQVPGLGLMEGRVYYLVFELAEGDIRGQMEIDQRRGAQWSLAVLSDVALGLWQVHREMIAHQDIKPSNVLAFDGQPFRIADFGRSSRKGVAVVHDEFRVPGDRSYAPPELIYGLIADDFAPRRIGTDMYMLGNLASFLFSGTNLTASIFARLNRDHHPDRWNGSYNDVLPYVQEAFGRVIEDLRSEIDPVVRSEIVDLVIQLANPDPARRGHPRTLGRVSAQYSLERYVSRLDLLRKTVLARSRVRTA